MHAAQLASAKVVKVTGVVNKIDSDGSKTQLVAGDILEEGDKVSARALSEADLVFSNGSELTVGQSTEMEIATLKQQSFSGSQSYEQLQADPSQSQTLLLLNYGSVSGHVKKLRPDSRFDIKTPLGTAAIRGTQFNVQVTVDSAGNIIFSCTNIDGVIDIISRAGGTEEWVNNTKQSKYDATLPEDVTEQIPQEHTIVISLGPGDRGYEEIYNLLQVPTRKPNVVTPGTIFGEEDELGIIVVSPEGPTNTPQSTPQ
ncbi:FecR family protein [Coraliomargarita sinensis]|uniref:FecR family protein n=1 Tax=Coraliomargarita sinensis TaxID=2174842 RepID=UPI001E561463|nr:FecR domain-containing protein [Coraliomargarita sinensis]